MKIALVGLPGCGKSTVAKHLAQQYRWAQVDTDQVIESRVGMPIRDFFSQQGEAAFRDLETEALRGALAGEGSKVVATGGGIVLRLENRALLREHALVFYIKQRPEELARRLRQDTKRPLLQGVDPLLKLRELSAQRDPLYRQTAHYVVEAQRPTVAAVAQWIAMQLELAGHVTATPKLAE